jgi:hypothetical protein
MSNNNRQRPDANIPAHMAAANPAVGNLSREQQAHGEGRLPRVPMNAGDYKLSVPDTLIPKDRVGYWFEENTSGRIAAAKAAYWEPVVDEFGVAITRPSGSTRLHLMSIEKIYYDQDQELLAKNYRDSMGERDSAPLDGGIESYVPSGHKNQIRSNSDPFA